MPWQWHRSVRVLKTWPSVGLVAVRKPPHVLCMPSRNAVKDGKVKSILPEHPYDHNGEHFTSPDGTSKMWLLHRLDLGTSGVLLLTTQSETSQRIKLLFKNRKVQKVYRAVVFGSQSDTALVQGQEWRDYLDQKGEIKMAVTVLAQAVPWGDKLHLLTLHPKTGFQHQLRKQCSLRQLPIVCDDKYGNFKLNRSKGFQGKRLLLHSESISFQLQGVDYEAHAPIEDEEHFLPANTVPIPFN